MASKLVADFIIDSQLLRYSRNAQVYACAEFDSALREFLDENANLLKEFPDGKLYVRVEWRGNGY